MPRKDAPALTAISPPKTNRGRHTRARLVEAARWLFAERGFSDVRIADLAAEAGTAHGTFYAYFESKEMIFSEVMRGVIADFSDPGPSGRYEEAASMTNLDEQTRRYLTSLASNAQLISVLEHAALTNDDFRELYRELRRVYASPALRWVRERQEAGLADPNLDPAITATALAGMVEHFGRRRQELDEPFDDDLVENVLVHLWVQAPRYALQGGLDQSGEVGH